MRFCGVFFLLLLICVPAVAAPPRLPYPIKPYHLSSGEKDTLASIENYLDSIGSISAEFLQFAPNGDITNGKFFLKRPGKLRMEYNPPTPVLMVTSGNDIVYYDRELDQISRISMDSTLVGFLARDKVRFDDSVTITSMERANKAIRISLIQANKPKDGMLTLEFSEAPITLHSMNVTDSSGQVTTVSLNNARFNVPLPAELFMFKDPHLGGSHVKH